MQQKIISNDPSLADIVSANILLVDDDKLNTAILRNALSQFPNVVEVNSGDAAIAYCQDHQPDLIILDVIMPELDGVTTCKILRMLPELENCPIIFSTSSTGIDEEVQCWEAGGTDFVPKPVAPRALLQRVKVHLKQKLRFDNQVKLALFDKLTGLRNRHFYDDYIEQQVLMAKRKEQDVSVLAIDVDYFKRYNDAYGHKQGDRCLKAIASLILGELQRPCDVAVRYGGEEFVVVLPDTDIEGARVVGKKIVNKVMAAKIPHISSEFGVVTVSTGSASHLTKPADFCLFEQADSNLYKAKNAGRNLCA